MDMAAEMVLNQLKEIRDIFAESAAIMDEMVALAESEDMTEETEEKAEALVNKLMLNYVKISAIGM